MIKRLSFSQCVDGYLMAAQARHLSPYTIMDYTNTFKKFQKFLANDPPFEQITSKQIELFLANQEVSKKSILNYHTGLSALWTWAVNDGIVKVHIVRKVARSKPEIRAVMPFSEEEIKGMLAKLGMSKPYTRPGKAAANHSLPNAERNRAMILLLLDTGIRASELCELKINQVDVKSRWIKVMGKGSKERTVPFSPRTGQALWRYLATRQKDLVGDRLFLTSLGDPIDRDRLLKTLSNIGERASVQGVNCHRFRHTFAINYLRNGGDPYTLQMMLGHSTMEMVRRYLALAQGDLERVHRLASPVDRWRL